jgi:hypothetical protein
MEGESHRRHDTGRAQSHMPDTVFYEKIVPALLVVMGVVLLILLAVALAVILLA